MFNEKEFAEAYHLARSKKQKLTLDQMMYGMGFLPTDTGPFVSELRKNVAKQMEEGLIFRSAGTWAPECGPAGMKLSAEQRAEAFLEVDKAIADGKYVDCPPTSERKPMSIDEWLKTKDREDEDQHRRIHWI